MNTSNKFGIWPIIMIMLLSVGLSNHVIILPLILDSTHRDAWLSVPSAVAIALPFFLLPFFRIAKSMGGVRIDVWLKNRMPRFIAWSIVWLFITVQLFIAFSTLVDTAGWTASTYLPRTPVMVVSIVMIALCGFAAWYGLQCIAYVSCVLLPIVVILGFFVMTANMPRKDYLFLLPMLENGWLPVMDGMLYVLSSYAELFLLLLVQQHINKPLRRWHLAVLVFALAVLTTGPTIGAIAEFGPETAKQMRFPAYAQWRLVVIGKYVEHVDFFAIYQWLSGALIRISIPIYLLTEFGSITSTRRKGIAIAALCAVMTAGAYYCYRNLFVFQTIVKHYYHYAWMPVAGLILLLWSVSYKKTTKEAKPE